jgi:hypothetical protein
MSAPSLLPASNSSLGSLNPVHTALPWAAVQFVLQVGLDAQNLLFRILFYIQTINAYSGGCQMCKYSVECLGAIVEGLEKVTTAIACCTIIESLNLGYSDDEELLEAATVKVYSAVLDVLVRTKEYRGRFLMSRDFAPSWQA